ncbi:MAG TPA: hypothetical protein VLT59_00935 [Steroidobacteraceae bacterium]|nr:hypothetical protein [Steroidobacteraceae bacterium]
MDRAAVIPPAALHRLLRFAWVAGLLAPVVAASAATYTVTTDAALTRFDVRACFEGPPIALAAGTTRADELLIEAALVNGPKRTALASRDARIEPTGAAPGDCIAYSVRLDADQNDRNGIRRINGAVIAPSRLWLWRPAESVRLRLEFALPEGLAVSAPWSSADGSAASFDLNATPASWRDQVAIGALQRFDVPIGDAVLRVALVPSHSDAEPERYRPWLAEAAGAVAGLYGRFPVAEAQVLLVESARSQGAVPWAQVLRGGAPAALFVVNPTHPIEDYHDDWTAVHEFAHLLLPHLRDEDLWVSEGFASYYQNVLRARAGMLSAADAWSKLWAGFRRGQRATDPRQTLTEATESRYGRQRMRVYWAGAALALQADIELRQRSAGATGLADMLGQLERCCLDPGKLWSGALLFRRLDALAGTDFLEPLYREYADSRQFPEVGPLYAALGIGTKGESVELHGEPGVAALRGAIDGSVLSSGVARGASVSFDVPGQISTESQ